MKTNCFYWAALLAPFLVGCTNDEVKDDKGDPQPEKDTYTSVCIKLPTVSSETKAELGYDAGEKGEYKVSDLTLLFFRVPEGQEESGIAENEFVLSEVVSTKAELSTGTVLPGTILPDNSADGDAGATTKTLSTGPIPISSNSVRVLALLNVGPTEGIAKELLKLGSPFSTINNALPIPGGNLEGLLGTDHDCFLMTSAPVYSDPNMKTLTKCVTSSNEVTAGSNPTAISVERVVAKVSLKAGDKYVEGDGGTYYFTVADDLSHSGDKITILGWTLGNTNTLAYPFRKVETNWSAIDPLWGNAICPSKTNPACIYWAVDPNYNRTVAESQFSTPTSVKDDAGWTDAAEYCLENTCDYNWMYKSQVTRLIVKAKYIPDKTKVTTGGNNTMDDDETWWSFTTVAEHYSAKNMYLKIIKWAHDNLNKDNNMPDAPTDGSAITTSEAGNTLTGVSGDNKWTITLESDGHLHYKLVKVSYFPTEGGAQKDLSGASLDAFHSSMGRIQKYDKGVCYYEIFVRHFTDEEGGYAPADGTPWVKEGEYAQAQLGRYGVVRNNWYTVTINSIKEPGEPTIPIDPEEPVDTETAYINCSIEISAWAKRDHSIDL
ncbi:Mfa1 family fimbria major subunit [Parabacteroides goldsteinii]|uniref:Mfa1 family fimbria major subunit n=1 Tax=Parabacteroides goldsteinii TaxID=328812 RepID=UPI0032B2D088